MSHLIIKPFDTVFTPKDSIHAETWHHLETQVEGGIARDGSNILPVLRPIVEAGFKPDFEGELAPLDLSLADHLKDNPITGWKTILADLRENGQGVIPVHVCKKSYKVHQNRALFNSMVQAAKQVLGEDGFEIATVGTLGAYSQFFVSIAIKGVYEGFTVGEGDAWKQFFNLVSSHNSLVASMSLLSVIRIVCMNTVQASIGDAEGTGNFSAIKHTVNSESLITAEKFEADLKLWLSRQNLFVEALKALRATPMTLDGFRSFAAGVFTTEGSDDLSTVSWNRIAEMESLFARGRGNAGVSAYDAINAFTEYFTSGAGVGKAKSDGANRAKRVASANFGRGNDWKLQALTCAATEESLKATLERGAILYSDKNIERAKA